MKSTIPLRNKVAVCSALVVVMLPVGVKTPCSAVVPVVPPPPIPPAELVAPPVVPVVPAFPPVAPVVPAVGLVVPPVAMVAPPLPPLHPNAPTMMTNMDSTAIFTKTEHRRFDMVPPVAGDAGAMDALSLTRGSVPGNTGLVFFPSFRPGSTWTTARTLSRGARKLSKVHTPPLVLTTQDHRAGTISTRHSKLGSRPSIPAPHRHSTAAPSRAFGHVRPRRGRLR